MSIEYRQKLVKFREEREVLTSEIQASMDDPRPAIHHDQVMRKIRQNLTQTDSEEGAGG